MSGFNDVVTRESAWFTTDPCPTYSTAPQLLHRTRTVTDGLVFTNSNVASSSTAAWTSADLGSTIGSSTSFASTATIQVITNASSVILSASSTASSTGSTFVVDNGAPFDVVQGYLPKVSKRGKALYITVEPGREIREEIVEMAGRAEILYPLLILIEWSFNSSTGSLEDEQQNLATAVNSVMVRLRGLHNDHTHNAQFSAVAAGGPEGDGQIGVRINNAQDAVLAGGPLIAEIRYTATDWAIQGA